MRTWSAFSQSARPAGSRATTSGGKSRSDKAALLASGQAGTPAALRALEHQIRDPVDGPDHEDGPDVGPEARDRKVRRNPLGQSEHGDVDHEIEEAEREDDQGKRE